MRILFTIFICLFVPLSALAQTVPNDDALDAQARDIGRSLRCVVCQNQSIEDSDADLAKDMRALVRTRLEAGDNPDEVVSFIRDRYGDYVLLKPPVQRNTWILWAGPGLILFASVLLLARRRTARIEIVELSQDEIQALEKLRMQSRKDPS